MKARSRPAATLEDSANLASASVFCLGKTPIHLDKIPHKPCRLLSYVQPLRCRFNRLNDPFTILRENGDAIIDSKPCVGDLRAGIGCGFPYASRRRLFGAGPARLRKTANSSPPMREGKSEARVL